MARATILDTPPELYVPLTSGVYKIKGQVHRFIRGQKRYTATHPLVKLLPDKFRLLTAEDIES